MATCTTCDAELTPVFDDHETTIQYSDALGLKLIGAYGMYFDDINDILGTPPPTAILCKDCADKLVTTFPALSDLMR